MKKILFITAIAAVALLTGSCKKDNVDNNNSKPVISGLTVNNDSPEVTVPADVKFSLSVSDSGTNLSSVTVGVLAGETKVAEKQFIIGNSKTKNYADEIINVPFAPGMANGSTVTIRFEAVNAKGAATAEEATLSVKRPAIDNLYMFLDDADTGTLMSVSSGNAYVYQSPAGKYPSSFKVVFANAETIDNASLVWIGGSRNGLGKVKADGDEVAGVVGYYPTTGVTRIDFNTLDFELAVDGPTLDYSINGKALMPEDNYLYAKISFAKDAEVPVSGIENLEEAYNRDFFSYDNGKLTFLRESGEYDVFYSVDYNFIWINKMDAVGPEAFWVVGDGFTSVPAYNESMHAYAWETAHPFSRGYIVKTADKKYQTHLFLSQHGIWETMEVQFLTIPDITDGVDNKKQGIKLVSSSLTGDTQGIKVYENDGGIMMDDGFQDGYYKLEFDLSGASPILNLTRLFPAYINPGDPEPTGMKLNGAEFWTRPTRGYNYAKVNFTKNAAVSFSGFADMGKSYNRDFFSYSNGTLTFLRESGEWDVVYHPDYDYLFVYQENGAAPDCYWAQGYGYAAAPVWHEDFDLFSYSTDIPFSVCIPKIDENKYQVSLYLKPGGDGDFCLEFYSERPWSKENGIGFAEQSPVSGSAGAMFVAGGSAAAENSHLAPSATFTEGYYRFVFDTANGGNNAKVEITKID